MLQQELVTGVALTAVTQNKYSTFTEFNDEVLVSRNFNIFNITEKETMLHKGHPNRLDDPTHTHCTTS